MKFALKVIGIVLLVLVIGIVLAIAFASLSKHINILPSYVEFIENILDSFGINFLTKIS